MAISRENLELIGSVMIMVGAAAVTFFSGLAALALPLVGFMALFAFQAAPNWAWLALLWLLAAWITAFYNMIAGVELINDPSLKPFGRLLATTAAIVLTCPALWTL